jgi:cyclic pyranopterin phosphate synthase
MARLSAQGPLEPATDKPHGHGPARYYQFGNGHVGFIGSITCEDFCATCNKLRLTADGKLRPCLGRHGEIDLMPALRDGTSDVLSAFEEAIANKPENHTFLDDFEVNRPMTAIGG